MVDRVSELLKAGADNRNFFKSSEIEIPQIRHLSTFRNLMRVTSLAPVFVTIALLSFILSYQPKDYMLLSFLIGSFVITLGAVWLTRYLLVALADTSEFSQNQFKQSEEHFRLLANSIPQLVSVADGDGNGLWYNDAWYRYTGSSPQIESAQRWGHVHHPNYLPMVQQQWKVALETGNSFETQFPIKGKDGTYRRFLYRATPIKDKNEKVIFWFGTSTDIESEVVQLEEQQFLKEANSVLNSSLNFNHLLSVSSRYSIPYLTDWGATVFFEEGDPESITDQDSSSPEDVAGLLKLVNWDLIRRKGSQVIESRTSENSYLKDIGFSSLAVFSISSSDGLKGVYLYLIKKEGFFCSRRMKILSEFTSLCTNAFENAELQFNLKEAVESRDDFISVASHELKTPLTSLQLQLQLLERQLKPGTEVKPENNQSISFCVAQIQKFSYLINQLFDTTQVRIGKVDLKKTSCDLSFHIKEVSKRFETEAKAKGVEFQIGNMSPIIGVWDSVRLEQIISNLVSNAIKYGKGKPVTISAEFLENKTYARFSVRDSGIGISEAHQRKIFDRFSRASSDSSSQGLGLGLYICRQLVHAHGGRIRVKSKLGEGSEFTVTLPVTA